MTTASPPRGATKSFTDLGVDADLAGALAGIGITAPFPIQELTLPLALSGADVIGQARTGTGKTLAFGLPLLQRVRPAKRRLRRRAAPVQGLVVVPTRELCLQVRDDLAQAGAPRGIEVVAVYGGRSIEPQIDALRGDAPLVVGTPGRLLDLANRGALDLSHVTALVLDEADEMLDLGFLPDVERIVEQTADDRQTLLFSATMPAPVVGLARRYMRKPTFLRADVEETRIAPETRQHFFSCHRLDKPAVLARILQAPSRGLCVVFVRTKRMADILANELRDRGIGAAPIHSDLRQEARERALARFRQGKIDVLVATEVAARGLDIDDVTHVVNYDCPDDEKMYLHRIGRTGRAGAEGVAITLAVWNELARLEMIKRALDIDEETHEVFSTSAVLDELFDLPPRDDARRGPSAEDWQRAVRQGERERRKGRAPAGAEAAEQESEPRARTRVRRRTRARDTEATDVGATQEPASGASATAEVEGRRRVRRRTRVSERPGPGTPQGDRKPARDGDAAARDGARKPARGGGGQPARDRDRKPVREGEARSRQGSRRSAEQATDDSADDGDTGRSRGRRGGRGGTRGGGRRAGPSRDRRYGRGDRAGKGAPVDAATARGDGRPRLRRPLEVTHLP